MSIRAVMLDLDGTLLDRRATFRHHLELQVKRHAGLFQGDAEGYVAELMVLDENGTLDRKDFYQRVETRLGLPPGSGQLLRSDFKTQFPEHCVPFRDMTETLARLKAMDLRVGLVTNGSVRTQTRKIDRLGIRRHLDCVMISEAVGFHKPDPRSFEAALRKLCVSAAETAFVGDNPLVDITGAKQAQLHAIWKRDDFWPEPLNADLVINEIRELPERLAELTISAQ